jgi:hypothetical protein
MTKIKYNNKELWAHKYCREYLFIDKKYISLKTIDSLLCDVCCVSDGQLIKCFSEECKKFSHIICAQILLRIITTSNNFPVRLIIILLVLYM